MGFSQIRESIILFLLSVISLFTIPLRAETSTSTQGGKILFHLHQGQHTKALEQYDLYYKSQNKHDYDLLHQIGLGIVKAGSQDSDPEIQLLALFGASVSANEETFPIIEGSLKNANPQIQLVALKCLAIFQNNRSDLAIIQALGSDHLLIRYEAAQLMCANKHPQAVTQTESLMYKVPDAALPLFPPLYAMAGNDKSIKILRRMLNHPSEDVRIASILSVAKFERDDLLPQLRQQITHFSYAQQEACAYAIGLLKDEESIEKLKLLSASQYPHVALSANRALYQLGQKEYLQPVIEAAQKGDVFAIAALGDLHEDASLLVKLLNHPDVQVRLNATLALLEQNNPHCFLTLKYLLIRDKYDLAFTQITSSGHTFKAWKAISSASQLLKDNLEAYVENLELRESIISKARAISEADFLALADIILASQQNDMVPIVVDQLIDLGTPKAMELLRKHYNKVGAPLVRNFCNLGLYKLKEPGPYGDLLIQWVKAQNKEELIRFRPFTPWETNLSNYELTPEEKSRLLVGAFEAFAMNQDEQGIQALLQAIREGNKKNKYALAGLLIRATQ